LVSYFYRLFIKFLLLGLAIDAGRQIKI